MHMLTSISLVEKDLQHLKLDHLLPERKEEEYKGEDEEQRIHCQAIPISFGVATTSVYGMCLVSCTFVDYVQKFVFLP